MMTLYETIKKYGNGKGEAMMWRSVETISDAIEKYMSEEDVESLVRMVYGDMEGCHYNEQYAMEDVEKMYYTGEDGKKHYAPYWTENQVRSVYDQIHTLIPKEYNFWDFFVVLQMMRSDNYNMLKKWFPDATQEEHDKKTVDLAVTWLNDEDNPYGTSKIWGYLNK